MTKLFLNLAMAVIITAASFSTAIAGPGFSIERDTDVNALILDFENWKTTNVELKIRSIDGSFVWSDDINAGNKSAIKYNLKELDNGNYIMQVADELTMTIQPIKVTDRGIELDQNAQRIVYQPIINLVGDKLTVNQLLLGNSTKLKLVDANYNTIFKESFKGEAEISKVFDIDKLERGNYAVVIHTQGQVFERKFSVR